MLTASVLLVHLVAFATYLGAGVAQTQILKMSARAGTPAAVRDAYERLTANIVTRLEVPAIFTAIASGAIFVAQSPAFMKQGWLHGKLTCVLLLAVVSHLEMFNARNIVRAREEGGDGVDADIARMKKRHATYGGVGALLLLGLLVFVTLVRLG